MIGGADTDCVAEGHGEGEGAGGGCAPSCAERKAKATSTSQSEWEAKKRSINNLHLYCCVGLSMEKKFPLQVAPHLNTALLLRQTYLIYSLISLA